MNIKEGGSSLFQSLFQILDDVIDVFNADRQTDHAGMDAGSHQLLIGQLTVGRACRVQHQGADIGNMNHQRSQLRLSIKRTAASLPPVSEKEMTPLHPFGRYFCAS